MSCTRRGKGIVQEEIPADTTQVAEVSARVETVYVEAVESFVETVYVAQESVVSPVVSPGTGIFTVQIGAFGDEENATALHNMLKSEYSELVYIENIPPYWKVRIGSYENHNQAAPVMDQLRNRGYKDAWIVSVGHGPE
jgi:cell division septation protein DedD